MNRDVSITCQTGCQGHQKSNVVVNKILILLQIYGSFENVNLTDRQQTKRPNARKLFVFMSTAATWNNFIFVGYKV